MPTVPASVFPVEGPLCREGYLWSWPFSTTANGTHKNGFSMRTQMEKPCRLLLVYSAFNFLLLSNIHKNISFFISAGSLSFQILTLIVIYTQNF